MKEIYQPGKVKSQIPYLIRYGKNKPIKNFDFILASNRFYYYDPDVKVLHWNKIWEVFDRWFNQVRANDPTFDWDQLCKLPYLRKSFELEKTLRFPVGLREGNAITSGCGRVMVIHEFFPSITIDAVVTCEQPRHDLQQIHCFAEYEKILLSKSYFRDINFNKRRWNFGLSPEGYIFSNDIGPTSNMFPFCQNSKKNIRLLNVIDQIVRSGTDTQKIFREITLLDPI